MKKPFMLLAFCFSTALVFASGIESSTKSRWNKWTNEQIEVISKNYAQIKDIGFKVKYEFWQASKQNPKILTDYVQFKETLEKIAKNNNYKYIEVIPQVALCNNEVGEDIVLAVYGQFKDKSDYVKRYYYQNSRTYRIISKSFSTISIIENASGYMNEKNYTEMMKFIEKHQFEMKDTQLIPLLKKMKRVAYPKISSSESWKQIVVKIELMLKSLE